MRCLHPLPGATYAIENDGSMVLLVEVASRHVLLTGDLEAGGVTELGGRHPGLRADVVELPHHGAFDERIAAFVRGLEPSVALQSTGTRRWRRDGWGPHLAGVDPAANLGAGLPGQGRQRTVQALALLALADQEAQRARELLGGRHG